MKTKTRRMDELEPVVVYVEPSLRAKIDAYTKIKAITVKGKGNVTRNSTVRDLLAQSLDAFDPVSSANKMAELCKSMKLD